MHPLLLSLPLPPELNRLVFDQILIKAWNAHQGIHHLWMLELKRSIRVWPVEHELYFPDHTRLHKYESLSKRRKFWWDYISLEPASQGKTPRSSIDQRLREKLRS
jgi:hypothetical protein